VETESERKGYRKTLKEKISGEGGHDAWGRGVAVLNKVGGKKKSKRGDWE